MRTFFTKYKAFAIGLVITLLLKELLEAIGFIRIDPNEVVENSLILLFWWLVFSLPIHYFDYLKKQKHWLFKIAGLLVLLILISIQDGYFNIPDNPVSLTGITVFWLGVLYLLFPSFFIKYRFPLIAVYGAIMLYFFYIRLATPYLSRHFEQVINMMLIPIPAFIGLWFFEQWKWLKNLKAEKGKAELALLKSQINPHFFFNTLNNLYGLTVEKSDKAPEVILKLSDMMRYTIYEGKEDWVTLQDEISYLKNYIELHKLRFQKEVDIRFEYNVDKAYKIAPLLFIILLENAFKHGAERLTEQAFIHLSLNASDDQLLFQIVNNFEQSDTDNEHGIGLDNLKRRLKLIYPERHQLSIQSDSMVYTATLNITLI